MRGCVYRVIKDHPKFRKGRGPRDGERVILVEIGEPEAKFVQQRRRNRIVVGNHQAAVLFMGADIGQKIVGRRNNSCVVGLRIERVLEAVAHVELVLGAEVVINPYVKPIGVRRNGHQCLIVIGRVQNTKVCVWQRIVI